MVGQKWLIFVALTLAPSIFCWSNGDLILNGTEQYVLKTAIADGELGIARSAAGYDRRRIVASEEYRPAYINGQNRRPNNDQVVPKQQSIVPGHNEPPLETNNNESLLRTNNEPYSGTKNEPPLRTNYELPLKTNDEPQLRINDEPPIRTNYDPPLRTNNEPPIRTINEPPIRANNEPPIRANYEPPLRTNNEPPIRINNEPPLRINNEPLVATPDAINSPNLSNKDVLETHHTTCQVTTEELVASAQATVTRVLKGLSTSQEIENHFRELSELMTDRLNELKDAVVKLESRVDDYNEALKRGKYQQMETLVQHCDNPKPGTATLSVSDSDSRGKISQDGQKTYQPDFNENEASGEETGVREPEIQKYNSSIHIEPSLTGSPKKVFTYYWRIPQVQYKLTEWNPRRSFRSQSFYIYPGGYRLYLRCYPRQNEANFFVHVGVTKGDFDQALKWPFPLKMKVAILDQTRDTRMFEDITSRVWDPSQLCSEFNWQRPTKGDNYECVGLGFPHDLLRQRGYITGDTTVAKLTVYLDA